MGLLASPLHSRHEALGAKFSEFGGWSTSAKLTAELQEIGKKMAAEWVAKAGAEGQAILKAYEGK